MKNLDGSKITYKKNVLDRVICQLRFRPILKIETTVPDLFQERIRKNFPIYKENTEIKIQVSPNTADRISSEILPVMEKYPTNKNHEFSTEDSSWVINLTKDFIALSTNKYRSWELFRDQLLSVLDSIVDIYEISEFSRLGLRYVNIIQRSKLNLGDEFWGIFLNDYLLGLMSTKEYGEKIINYDSKYEIRLDDNQSNMRVITQLVERIDSGEKCLQIDNDIFTNEMINFDSISEKLDYFNMVGTEFFLWVISERLHDAMEPVIYE